MKGTTIELTTEQLSDITFALNQTITYYEMWEKEVLSSNENKNLEYIRKNIKNFKSLKNKILNKAK